jgi:hypothetical protein
MSTYSPSLRVELITAGDQAGQWGNTTNDNFSYIFDAAIAGYVDVTTSVLNHVLTYNNGPVADENLNQSIQASLRLDTSTGAAFNVFAPPVSKQYIIWNNSMLHAATIYNSSAISNTTISGPGVTIAPGAKVLVFSTGAGFYEVQSSSITGILPIANGGTNAIATPTAGGISYGTGSAYAFTSAGTSGQVLTSNGAGAPTWVANVSSVSFGSTGLTPSTATTGAVTVAGTLNVANGGTGLTSYTANGVLYASGTGALANGSGFVFDGTNVGVGESSPSTYGKFVVGGTGSFTNALVSTSSTLTDSPTFEFRKTMNVTSGQTSSIGRISFNGKWGSTAGEQAYISAASSNVGVTDATEIRLAVKSLQTPSANERYLIVGATGIMLEGGSAAGIHVTNSSIVNIYGNIQSPTFTGTPITPTAASGTNTTQVASTAFVQAAVRALYPVGSIYINATNSTNPGTLLGFGTWTAFGAGRVPVGFNASNTLFDTAEETGGSADAIVVSHTHTATTSITDPGHAHNITAAVTGGGSNISQGTSALSTYTTTTATTGITAATTVASSGSSGTNANYQPYITVYMWKRTA